MPDIVVNILDGMSKSLKSFEFFGQQTKKKEVIWQQGNIYEVAATITHLFLFFNKHCVVINDKRHKGKPYEKYTHRYVNCYVIGYQSRSNLFHTNCKICQQRVALSSFSKANRNSIYFFIVLKNGTGKKHTHTRTYFAKWGFDVESECFRLFIYSQFCYL